MCVLEWQASCGPRQGCCECEVCSDGRVSAAEGTQLGSEVILQSEEWETITQ